MKITHGKLRELIREIVESVARFMPCPDCGGSGQEAMMNDVGETVQGVCERCGGSGRVVDEDDEEENWDEYH